MHADFFFTNFTIVTEFVKCFKKYYVRSFHWLKIIREKGLMKMHMACVKVDDLLTCYSRLICLRGAKLQLHNNGKIMLTLILALLFLYIEHRSQHIQLYVIYPPYIHEGVENSLSNKHMQKREQRFKANVWCLQ